MRDFLRTLNRIWSCDGINPIIGTAKHILWQRRKFQKSFRIELKFSKSKIVSNNPIGVSPLVNCMGIYDYNNMNLIIFVLNIIKGVFVDIGSNVGSYTLIASELENVKVISIEPHPKTYQSLIENIKINRRLNIFPINVGLSDKTGVLFLLDNSFDSTKNKIVEIDYKCEKDNYVKVPGKTLDELCRELKIKPSVIKIDVEGYESKVLKGFENEHKSVQMILIENGETISNKKKLYEMDFIGPLYMHFKKRKLLPYPHRSKEDPVFIRENLQSVFENHGLSIEL